MEDMRIDYERIINSLQLKNDELMLRVNLLKNICDRLQDYISDNNLNHTRVEFKTLDDKYIEDLEKYNNLVVMTIPELKFVISNESKGE